MYRHTCSLPIYRVYFFSYITPQNTFFSYIRHLVFGQGQSFISVISVLSNNIQGYGVYVRSSPLTGEVHS